MSGTSRKNSFSTFICLVLLAGMPLRLPAQQNLTLQDCVEMALESNKDIEAARHQQRRYEYERRALKANFFPSVSISAIDLYSTFEGSRTFDIATPMGLAVGQSLHDGLPWLIGPRRQRHIAAAVTDRLSPLNPSIDYGVGSVLVANANLTQPIFMGGKIMAGYKMGTIGAQIAELGEVLTREQTIVAVHEAYLLLAKAKEMREVAAKYDSLLVQLSHDVESAFRYGMASNNDIMKVRVKKNEAELKLKQADNGIRLARMNLCHVVGLPAHASIDIVGDENENSGFMIDPCVAVEDRTESRLLELKIRLAEEQVKIERSAMLPQLGLSANATMMDGLELSREKVLDREFVFNVGIFLKIPIYHAGQSRSKVMAAKEDLARLCLERESLQEKMILELQQQTNEVEEAGLELAMRRSSLEQCAENLRMSRKAYSVGSETLSELINAQLLWQQAYAEMVEAKFQHNIKIVKWQKDAGKLLQN